MITFFSLKKTYFIYFLDIHVKQQKWSKDFRRFINLRMKNLVVVDVKYNSRRDRSRVGGNWSRKRVKGRWWIGREWPPLYIIQSLSDDGSLCAVRDSFINRPHHQLWGHWLDNHLRLHLHHFIPTVLARNPSRKHFIAALLSWLKMFNRRVQLEVALTSEVKEVPSLLSSWFQ